MLSEAGGGVGRNGKMGEKDVKEIVIKGISHMDVIYNMAIVVDTALYI